MVTTFVPTEEQKDIQETFERMMEKMDRSFRKMVIQAGAGTGKTATLVSLALIGQRLGKKGKFLAFNKAIKEAAAAKMPANIGCSTFHGYFYGTTGSKYTHRSDRISAKRTAEILGITETIELSEKKLTPIMQARIVYRAISKFSKSDDYEISRYHIKWVRGLSPEDMEIVRDEITPYLKPAWEDIVRKDGELRFVPENYIKIGAMSNPKIAASFVMVDEAQDTMPVILGWLKRQPHIRLIIVGDSAQAINEWNDAVDAMDKFESIDRETGLSKEDVVYKTLTKSFRFGPELADEANRWLYTLNGGEFLLTGNEAKPTIVTDTDDNGVYDAIICRTNAGVFNAAMMCVEQGIKTSMSERNMNELKQIADAATQLMAGNSCDYEPFAAFDNWSDVLEAVENDPGFSDLKTLVTIIEQFGPSALIRLSGQLVHASIAQTKVITAHTSKGLEFKRVMIWNDYPDPNENSTDDEPEMPADFARLAYVAITRAEEVLVRGDLAIIDKYVSYDE